MTLPGHNTDYDELNAHHKGSHQNGSQTVAPIHKRPLVKSWPFVAVFMLNTLLPSQNDYWILLRKHPLYYCEQENLFESEVHKLIILI